MENKNNKSGIAHQRRLKKINSILNNRLDKTVKCESCGSTEEICPWCNTTLITFHHLKHQLTLKLKGKRRCKRYILLCKTCHLKLHDGKLNEDQIYKSIPKTTDLQNDGKKHKPL